ncbi:MAG: hypothetical protein ACTTKH_07515 [Treponema sp.]
MNKLLIFLIILVMVLSFAVYVLIPKHKSNIENEVREARTKDYRSLTIINKTGEQLIAECILTTVSGIMVARQEKTTEDNIVFANFDSKGAFKNEKEFKITLIDRFGLKYEKIFNAKLEGNTDVTIDEKAYISQDGDWFKKVKRFFNK